MKQLSILFLFLSTFIFSQNKKLNVDSLFLAYQTRFDTFSEVDPSINELENKRNNLNESLGLIIFESNLKKRQDLIKKNISKENQSKLLKMSTSEIEEMRKEYDDAFKNKIVLNCLRVELKYRELLGEDMQKSQIKFLLDNGYNLDEFNKLSDEEKNKILKNWKYSN